MFLIFFYVPIDQADLVKQSMFKAGAGSLGNYDSCSFEIRGVGQFRPLVGSDPFIGDHGKLERVEELKIEMICPKEHLKSVLEAMKMTHPYETPAYGVVSLLDV